MEPIYSIRKLCELTDESPRTVHYYVQAGLLPAPGSPGRGPRYHDGHVARLRLIRRLQREHLPLAEIRARLENLGYDDVVRLSDEVDAVPDVAAPPAETAIDYVRSLLSGDRRTPLSPLRDADVRTRSGSAGGESPDHADASERDVRRALFAGERAQWDRISLTPDVELHVRRPLSRDMNRRLERLLEAARTLFLED